MTRAENMAVARNFIELLGSGGPPAAIADLFTDDMTWDVPGDTSAFPWIGSQVGKQALLSFLAESADRIERIYLKIDDVLASDARAVIVGRLASRIKRTGRGVEMTIAIILATSEGRISRFQLLEDSFAVSQAAHADGPAA